MKLKIKRNDTVIVIAGKDKGKVGKVRSINRESNKVIVDGVNMVTKHIKRTVDRPGSKHKTEAAIHISNVALYDAENSAIIKVGFTNVEEDGKRRTVRINKKTNQQID
jgi:large subunit ribosomal protein L24